MEHDETGPTNVDPIAKLLQRAGKRPAPTPEAVARIHARVHAEWRAAVRQKQRQRWFALAASIVVVAVGSLWMLSIRDRLPAAVIARLERGGAGISGLRPDGVLPGDRIDTADAAGAVLRTLDASGNAQMSLRLAPHTSLHWIDTARVELLRGALYVDTGADARADVAAARLVVEASGVRVEHVGTRFLTRQESGRVDVLVRDGMVRVQAAGTQEMLARGEQGRVRKGSDGNLVIERLMIAPDGTAWDWVDALAPRIALEGHDLRAVTLQLAREAGFDVKFESAALEDEAATTVLHGPALDLPPGQALQTVLATTRFELRAQPDGSRLLVRTR